MAFLNVYGIAAAVIFGCMTLLWILSLIFRNTSIVDIFWGTGFVIANWLYFFLAPSGFIDRKWLIGVLVTIWGLRLSVYILYRNWGEGEDYRYQEMREGAGDRWWWQSYFQVFLLQGLLMLLISTPLLVAHISPDPARLILVDYLAILVWVIGFFFEAVGDLQMILFKSDPSNEGQVLNTGLWRYTRHPNYFGDATQWWAYYLLGLAAGGWWTVFSPVIMTIMLLRVSGVALLEDKLKETKPKYEEYVERTSAFVPWFPKEEA